MNTQIFRNLLSAATLLTLVATGSMAMAGSKTMLDVDLQLDSTYSGSVTGAVLLFKDASNKVVATCAPDAAVFANNGRVHFDCAVSGTATWATSAKFVSDQYSQGLQVGVTSTGKPALGNDANYAVGNLYAFDVDGSEPLFFDVDGSEPLFFDVDGSEPLF